MNQQTQSNQANLLQLVDTVTAATVTAATVTAAVTESFVLFDPDANILIVTCPHCSDIITIEKHQLNCCIFRHGVIKTTGDQIPPHAPKSECDNLFNNDLIYGCGKPFQIIKDTTYPDDFTKMKIVICDYI